MSLIRKTLTVRISIEYSQNWSEKKESSRNFMEAHIYYPSINEEQNEGFIKKNYTVFILNVKAQLVIFFNKCKRVHLHEPHLLKYSVKIKNKLNNIYINIFCLYRIIAQVNAKIESQSAQYNRFILKYNLLISDYSLTIFK